MKFLPNFALICVLIAPSAEAAIVWSDDFSRASLDYDYAGGTAGTDYSTVSTGSPTIISSQYLNFADGTTGQFAASVLSDQYSARPTAAGDRVTISYDFRVNSLGAASNASVTRLSVMNGNTTGGQEAFTIGFSYATFNTTTNQLGFFWGTAANASPATANGIGTAAGTSGFNFGTYDSATAANNDTNLSFFRVMRTMIEGSTAVNGSITRLDSLGAVTADVVNFNATMSSALAWSSVGSDGIKVTTGASGTGNFDFDNISINIVPVPEPSAALTALLGLCAGNRPQAEMRFAACLAGRGMLP